MKNKTPPTSRYPALLALGLTLVLASAVSAQEEETAPPGDEPAAEQAAEQVPEAAQPTAEEAVDQAQEAVDQAEQAADQADETADETEEAVDQAEQAVDQAEQAADQVEEEVPPAEERPEVAPPTGERAIEGAAAEETSDIELDSIIPTAREGIPLWQIQALYELHFNLISDAYSGNDWLAFYLLRGDYNVTDNDQLSLRMDLEQHFIADPDESGAFFGDMRFYYSRRFSLPIPDFRIPGKASVYVTAPTSRESQARGYVTTPTGIVALVPSYGPFSLYASYSFRWWAARYAESSERGDPNTLLTQSLMFQLFYMPLDWFAPSVAWIQQWSLPYATRENETQDWQRYYYFEAALNFTVPMPDKWPSLSMSLAYAQGANVLEGGVYRLYFAKRDQSELYFGLNLVY